MEKLNKECLCNKEKNKTSENNLQRELEFASLKKLAKSLISQLALKKNHRKKKKCYKNCMKNIFITTRNNNRNKLKRGLELQKQVLSRLFLKNKCALIRSLTYKTNLLERVEVFFLSKI